MSASSQAVDGLVREPAPADAPRSSRFAAVLRSRLFLLLAYASIALAILGANPFKGESITPLDALVQQHAFAWANLGTTARFGERSDVLNGVLPTWLDARTKLRDGEFPVWNEYLAGGNTYLFPSYGMFTPAFATFVAAPTPALGFHLAIALNLIIAGLGMHLFLRRHVGDVAAACGGITFMLCGFNAAWLYWAQVHTMIWAPWLLLAIERCTARPDLRGSLLVAAATVMVVLGGFPFVAEMILCAGGLYMLVGWAWSMRSSGPGWRLPGWFFAGSALGLLICLPLLAELANWLAHYDLGYRDGRGSYLRLEHATRLLPPWSYEFKRVEQTMYVGLLMTLAAGSTLLVALFRPRRLGRVTVFAILLTLITAGLVFGVWPMWLVGWFPGMAFNSWSRAIGVLDLGLIVLGAIAIDRAWRGARALGQRLPRTALTVALALLALAQIAEQAHFFRRYNGPVPASYFFPQLPAVEYVRARVGEFDYVVADNSFGIAGELGAYQLRDWFAHQLRTPAHRDALAEMVPRHRRSHTASRFRARDIRTGSLLLADFNNRFLIVHNADRQTTGPARRKQLAREAMPPLDAAGWTQGFSVPAEGMRLRSISLRMATYGERMILGTVRLSVRTGAGDTLAEASVDARTIVDNALVEFHFERPLDLSQGRHAFRIDYMPEESPARPLTAWVLPAVGDETLLVGSSPRPGELEYLLHVGDHVRGPYRRVFAAAGLAVFESSQTPNGPYFIPALAAPAPAGGSPEVTLDIYSTTAFTLRYTGKAAGHIVIPQILTRDWVATVDGHPVQPALRHGVMPAVPVQGPSTIELRYRPVNVQALWAWAGALLLVLGLMWLCARQLRARDRGGQPA